ncbi:acyl-CoA dehydrogenase [Streptomyces sp. NPDC101132]|uniref:acyl-CoA dehydrogenase n=1 Tax=Streptomyces sp. NPDC101132 TaxID=3366110 RepID=UPI0038221A9F
MSAPTAAITAARAAGAVAARHAAEADAGRRLHGDVVAALTGAGFARRFVPEHLGGEPVTFTELTEAVAAVGEGCASAAWVASLTAHVGRFATYLPLEGQEEVWEKGPDTRLVAAVVPQGTTGRVDGGWRISGTWNFLSGVEFCDWALLLGPAAPGGRPTGKERFFVVRRDDFVIEDTWDTLGMRATGSHSVRVDDVFVPDHRTFRQADLFEGRRSEEAGGARTGVPGDGLPIFAVNGLTFAAPVLGAARGALALAEQSLGGTDGRPPARDAYRTAFALSAGEIDAAGLLLRRVAETADLGGLTPGLVTRARRDSALATRMLAGAVDRLFKGNGVRSTATGAPLQRYWRDVTSAATHGVLQFEPAALEFTRR